MLTLIVIFSLMIFLKKMFISKHETIREDDYKWMEEYLSKNNWGR